MNTYNILVVDDLRKQPLIGFRSWRIDDEGILPVSASPRWRPGINTARCGLDSDIKDDESVPHEHPCHCGFNAWFYPEDEHKESSFYRTPECISGAIAGAGKIQLHSKGFRSKEAQVLCLYVYENFSIRKIYQVEKVAKNFQIPVFYNKEKMLSFVCTKGALVSDYVDWFKTKQSFHENPLGMIWKPDTVGGNYSSTKE